MLDDTSKERLKMAAGGALTPELESKAAEYLTKLKALNPRVDNLPPAIAVLLSMLYEPEKKTTRKRAARKKA